MQPRFLLLLSLTVAAVFVAGGPRGSLANPGATATTEPKSTTAAPKAAPAAPAAAGPARKATQVTLLIRHRVFHDFQDIVMARVGDEFVVGDTDFKVRMTDYVPDFAMDVKSRKVISRSNQPNNPAFRLVVTQKGVPQDTTWAMLDIPPHYARNSMLAFQVMRIDFDKGKPMLAKQTEPMKSTGTTTKESAK